MLIRRPVLDAIAAGEVTLQFRRWARPRVRAGSKLRTAVGLLAVEAVDAVDPGHLTAADARAAGYGDVAELRAALDVRSGSGDSGDSGTVFRVALRPVGPDPRVALRERADLDTAERAWLRTRLDRLDRTARHGPWTAAALDLIAENPGVRAADLAARLGRETPPFKRDVRKLSELGLTESLPVGYRLSARGRALLDAPP